MQKSKIFDSSTNFNHWLDNKMYLTIIQLRKAIEKNRTFNDFYVSKYFHILCLL